MRRREVELREARAAWAARPDGRPMDWDQRGRTGIADPSMGAALDRLSPKLWSEGLVTWGWMASARTVAWEEGDMDTWGQVLWSHDPWVEAHPTSMEAVGRRLWWFQEPPEFAGRKLDLTVPPWDRARSLGVKDPPDVRTTRLPRTLGQSRVILHRPVAILRDDLLHGRLLSQLVLLLVTRDERASVRLLPSTFWPDSFRQGWERELATG